MFNALTKSSTEKSIPWCALDRGIAINLNSSAEYAVDSFGPLGLADGVSSGGSLVRNLAESR